MRRWSALALVALQVCRGGGDGLSVVVAYSKEIERVRYPCRGFVCIAPSLEGGFHRKTGRLRSAANPARFRPRLNASSSIHRALATPPTRYRSTRLRGSTVNTIRNRSDLVLNAHESTGRPERCSLAGNVIRLTRARWPRKSTVGNRWHDAASRHVAEIIASIDQVRSEKSKSRTEC
jgi:hypothetical protein